MNTQSKSSQEDKKDVFNSFLVKDAMYDGEIEIPKITTSNLLPEKVISFSKAKSGRGCDSWIHFYEQDSRFECFWNNPQRYLPIIKRYKGIISPDYSLYYDMPLCMQMWNIYRGRALAHWLNENGVDVIPNIRWGDNRTFEMSCLGVEGGKTIAVGTHGCIKTVIERNMFIAGFDYVVNRLEPQTIVVYGRLPDKIFNLARMQGIQLIPFESEFGVSHKREVEL